MIEIELGSGDIIISDIYSISGEWAGIAMSHSHCQLQVGETVDTGTKSVEELDLILTIKTDRVESLDVLIGACNRAKAKLVSN